MTDLQQIESICEVFYNQPGSPDWAAAKGHLDMLSSSVDQIPRLQHILDQSSNYFALLLAATSLKNLFTSHWNNFSAEEHVATRDYLLRFLAEKGPAVPPFVLSALLSLLCRIAKLGWFDDPRHREIVDELTKFLTASVDHCEIGLRALNLLVGELNAPTPGFTLTQHRKSAVAFRDKSLLGVANVALGVLKQLATDAMPGATPAQKGSLGHQALLLVAACLSFDFIGTNPDESAEDVGAIQVPAAWRETVIDPSTTALLVGFYSSAEPPLSSTAMQAMVMMSSVRRSLFRSEPERAEFLHAIMAATHDVLKNGTGLQHSENYHEFCRLLGRLKSNYQLTELMDVPNYREWLDLACRFTESSFSQWRASSNSLVYLLQLWTRLVAAVPYVPAARGRHVVSVSTDISSRGQGVGGGGLAGSMSDGYSGLSIGIAPERGDTDEGGAGQASINPDIALLETCVVRVVSAYVDAMLSSVAAVAAEPDTLDDPLEDDGQVAEQLERIPSLFRYQYPQLAAFLLSRFDPCLTRYQQLLQQNGSGVSGDGGGGGGVSGGGCGGSASAAVTTELGVCEGQLAWLCYFAGAVLSGQTWSTGTTTKGVNERLDGQVSARVLQLSSVLDYRLEASVGASQCGEKLCLACVYALSQFRKAYLNDSPMPASMSAGATLSAMGTPLLQLAWDADSPGGPMTLKQRGTAIMFEALDRGDQAMVGNALMNSVLTNLRFWGDSEEILGSTLKLFLDLSASSPQAASTLSLLPGCQWLLAHHTEAHLPFLGAAGNRRLRTALHASLARLVFMQSTLQNQAAPSSTSLLLSLATAVPSASSSLFPVSSPGVSSDAEVLEGSFSAFLAPLVSVLHDICAVSASSSLAAFPGAGVLGGESDVGAQALRSDARVRLALMGVCRDLRGVCQAVSNKRTYVLLFDALYPSYLPFFARAAEVFADDPDVINALLKMLLELVSNKGQRCSFGNASPNGMLLFKECSRAVVCFGRKALGFSAQGLDHRTQGGDLYRNTYKGYATAMRTLKEALCGGYVNFAVFALYGDSCLVDALRTALGLMLDCPLEHVLAYPKLSRHLFALLEEIFHHHLPFLAAQDTPSFMKVIELVYSGLCSLEPPMSAHCSNSVDFLATYLFTHRDKGLDADTAAALAAGAGVGGGGVGASTAGGCGGTSEGLMGSSAMRAGPHHPNSGGQAGVVYPGSKMECGLTMARLRMHFTSSPALASSALASSLHSTQSPAANFRPQEFFSNLTEKLFEQLLFGPFSNHWTVTRPMLSIMLADESCFTVYRAKLLATQTLENQQRLGECFDRLFADVEANLDINNRDRFAQRLANFRQKVREFLTL